MDIQTYNLMGETLIESEPLDETRLVNCNKGGEKDKIRVGPSRSKEIVIEKLKQKACSKIYWRNFVISISEDDRTL